MKEIVGVSVNTTLEVETAVGNPLNVGVTAGTLVDSGVAGAEQAETEIKKSVSVSRLFQEFILSDPPLYTSIQVRQ